MVDEKEGEEGAGHLHHWSLVCDRGSKICMDMMVYISKFLVIITLPVSIFFCIKYVQVRPLLRAAVLAQEYERAVIYRLGLMLPGGTQVSLGHGFTQNGYSTVFQ